MSELHLLILSIVLLPLAGALLAGLFGKTVGRSGAHWLTNLAVGTACLLSCWLAWQMAIGQIVPFSFVAYQWAQIGGVDLHVGFLIDQLTVLMMVVVTFVSWMVHIYTIGYMKDDPGYQRFFSYISLFTFAMLMLVMADNFLQLFFGWEAVGLVSYLLIGFWFKKDSAVFANLKAFLVNRVGDFGFLLGIAGIFYYFGSFDYQVVFSQVGNLAAQSPTISLFAGAAWPVLSVIGVLLFVGAMGKSAQVPLHVWLPDSMEGPTPISALIHAATMVTAGVFMVARLSPVYEYAEFARVFILTIGVITALFMGVLGLVQNDIKRIIAYSTLSQLGYMVTALGASAYAVGIFHLMTHAFFKALLFLGAGSVIIAMHHVQDIRQMGNLRKYMPITYLTAVIGSLALAGIPPFSGFFSKDFIIEAVALSPLPGAGLAYYALLIGVFITALYSFRLLFLVFHTQERMDEKTRSHLTESPAVVWLPLVLLAIPSLLVGGLTVYPLLFAEPGFFDQSIWVNPLHDPLLILGEHYHGAWPLVLHAVVTPAFWLAIAGVVVAWLAVVRYPQLPKWICARCGKLICVLQHNYGFDQFNQWFFVRGANRLGGLFWRLGDVRLIDGILINGTANSVAGLAQKMRLLQSGYLYHYALAMVIGLAVLLLGFVWFMA